MLLAISHPASLASRSPSARALPASLPARPVIGRRAVAARSATEDADAELEKRLERLRTVKGATPYGQGSKAAAATKAPESSKPKPKKEYDWSGETVYYEGPPHRGDLAVNLALGTTLVWLPLTFAAIGRGAFVNYRFTDKRFTVTSNAPWKTEQTDVAYQEVKDVITVGRGVGLWGDMVVTLKDGSKIELRSLDRFQDLKAYVLKRRDELSSKEGIVTAGELLGETSSSSSGGSKKKGFA